MNLDDPNPKLLEKWAEHKGLIFKCSSLIARRFSGIRSEELVSSLFLVFNRCLNGFDETRASFSTYFFRAAWKMIIGSWISKESDGLSNWWASQGMDDDDPRKRIGVNRASHGGLERFYFVPPPDDEWTDEVFGLFSNQHDLWSFLMRDLKPREVGIVIKRFRWAQTQAQIAADEGLSKQRVEQIERKALEKIRLKVQKLEMFNSLFKQAEGKTDASDPVSYVANREHADQVRSDGS